MLPTGSGKTEVGIQLIIELRLPTIILVPTKVLIDNTWVPRLRSAGIAAGVYYGEEKRPAFVTVSTYQSLYANPALIRSYDLVIFDEGDLAIGDAWKKILDEAKLHPYAVVLTATLPMDPDRKRELLKAFPLVASTTPKEQIRRGVFVPVTVLDRYVDLTIAERKAYDELDKKLKNLRHLLGTGNPQEIVRMTASAQQSTRQAAFAYLKFLGQRQDVLARTPARAAALLQIVRENRGQRVLVFGTRVESLSDALAYLTMNGIPSRIISGDTRATERRIILDEWGHGIQVVGSVDVLTRGVNVPEAAVAVLLGGGKGLRRLVQRVGRIVRTTPTKTIATLYLVVARGTMEADLVAVAKRTFSVKESELPPPKSSEEDDDDG